MERLHERLKVQKTQRTKVIQKNGKIIQKSKDSSKECKNSTIEKIAKNGKNEKDAKKELF